MMEKISVIVPVYNVEKYIKNCIESILNQTFHDLEIILVDDGSTDMSGNICDDYKIRDSRISVIHKKNGGLSDARNEGIKRASGEFITFVDSDDYISHNAIEYLYGILIDNQADVSIGKLYKTSKFNEDVSNSSPIVKIFNNKESIKEMLYGTLYSTAAPGKLYRSCLFDDVCYPYKQLNEDLFTTYKILDKASRVVYGNQIVYYYFCRVGSIMTSSFTKRRLDSMKALEEIAFNIPLKQYKACGAYSSQVIENIIILLELRPNKNEIKKYKLWKKIKDHRLTVLMDSNANKRIKCFALLSYLGISATMNIVIFYYSNKWNR